MRIVQRLGWAVAVALVAALFATAAHLDQRLGGGRAPTLVFDVSLPPEARADAVRRILFAWNERFGRRVAIEPRGPGTVRVAVAGVAEDEEVVRDLLTRRGELTFHETAHDAAIARTWYAAARDGTAGPDVKGELDAWTSDRTGERFEDPYLRAPSPEALDAALAQLPPPPDDLVVVHERVTLGPDSEAPTPYVRTYLVRRDGWDAGADIASAVVTYSQYDNRPEVLLRFTAAGARRFGELTERIVGHKLVIVLDGVVASAPIVQSAIHGGATTITMGGSDPVAMQAEASALVNVLRAAAALPAGIVATLVEIRPGAGGSGPLPTLALSLVAGLLAFVAAGPLSRRLPTDARPVAPGRRGLVAVVVGAALTIGVPLALILLAPRVHLPGLDLERMLGAGLRESSDAARTRSGVFALGVMAVLNAFWLVEAWACVVPGARRRRLGTVGDRVGLDRAALALGLLFAAVQGYTLAQFLLYLDRGGPGDGPLGARLLITLSLVAGVAVHVAAADLISRHGLCNGYVAIVGVGAARALYRALEHGPLPGLADDRAALAAGLALVALLVLVASALRDGSLARRRLPWLGLGPAVAIVILAGTVSLLLQAASLIDPYLAGARWLHYLTMPPRWLGLAAVVALTAALLALRGRPVITASKLGLAVSVGLIAALVLIDHLAPSTVPVSAWLLPVVLLVAGAADALAAARARLGMARPTIVLAVHDVDRADRAVDALAAAGVAASVENLRTRALLRGLASFAPIVVRVDEPDAPRAAALIAEAEVDRDPQVAVFAA